MGRRDQQIDHFSNYAADSHPETPARSRLIRFSRTTGGAPDRQPPAEACCSQQHKQAIEVFTSFSLFVAHREIWKGNDCFLSCFPTHTALCRAIGICIFKEFAYSNCFGRTADLDSLDSNHVAFQGVGDLLHTTTHQNTYWLGRRTEGGTRERQRLAIFHKR